MKIGIPGREHEWSEHNICMKKQKRKIERKKNGMAVARLLENHSQICNTPIRFKGIRTGIKKHSGGP